MKKKTMNDGLKMLIWSFAIATVVAVGGCLYENYYPSNKNWTGAYSHCEIHIDRPLDEVLRETIYDNETPGERGVREAEERAQDTDFGQMS